MLAVDLGLLLLSLYLSPVLFSCVYRSFGPPPATDRLQQSCCLSQWLLSLSIKRSYADTAKNKKHFCLITLTLDTNTVNRNLKLSDNNRKVTDVREDQSYPDHPDRFDNLLQLLCSNGLTGRCYWEVEWRGRVNLSVSYRGIHRKGKDDDCEFGCNDQSWRLTCSDAQGYSVHHNKRETSISSSSSSSSSSSVSNRVAVYVDCPAGTLSFYRVSSDTLIHLHTFNTTFTEPLYAGFMFQSYGSSVSLCPLSE
ncbi:stonustoxin subunit alpha-like [Scomber scombrus]|uniref:stonustoxin subunit alpha-like n=1 Tax=Scomber scombrus TaxID=13677 RepID=UPI002DD91766|nr:stonustoxin subunit alpha-like [Scomber scombrus]